MSVLGRPDMNQDRQDRISGEKTSGLLDLQERQ